MGTFLQLFGCFCTYSTYWDNIIFEMDIIDSSFVIVANNNVYIHV